MVSRQTISQIPWLTLPLLIALMLPLGGTPAIAQKSAHLLSSGLLQKIDFTDSRIGGFLAPGKRNADDRERILSILADQEVIRFDRGDIYIINDYKLRKYYEALRESGALDNIEEYRTDKHDEKAGQFWRNFIDRKDHLHPDMPATMDPFQNLSRGLPSAMHKALQTASAPDYGATASKLQMRGIDILNSEAKKGLAAGADAMIKSLNLITGGASGEAAAWLQGAAEAASKVASDPSGAAKSYLKDRLYKALDTQFEDELKLAMGEKTYESMMENYKSYGDKQQRFEAMMQDMYKRTGDGRFAAAARLVKEASADAIAAKLADKVKISISPKKKDTKKEAKDGKKEIAKRSEDEKETQAGQSGAQTREVIEAAVILDQLERASPGKHPTSKEWLTKFANLVHDGLAKDGVLDPHNTQHIAAVSRLLAIAVQYGQDSKQYQKELDAFVILRRNAIAQAQGEACKPKSDAERLATGLRDRGAASLRAGDKAQAIKYLRQSYELCRNPQVATALAALEQAAVVLKGTVVWNQSDRTKAFKGSITLNIAEGRVSGSIVVPAAQDTRTASITGQISADGSITAKIEGNSVYKGSTSDKWSFLGKAVANFAFSGSFNGALSGNRAGGSFQVRSLGKQKISISGSWQASRS